MLLALSEVRLNNYWLRKPTFLDLKVMEENKIIGDYEERRIKESTNTREILSRQDVRQDKYADLDHQHLFNKEEVVMKPGEYQRIDTI